MPPRQQLRLIFSNNTMRFSPRPRTSRSVSPQCSPNVGSTSPFLQTMTVLERVNPAYAHVLEKLARQMIARAEADVATE